MKTEKKVKLAVNGGISIDAKLNIKQLIVLADCIGDPELELTTFQQLYRSIRKRCKLYPKEIYRGRTILQRSSELHKELASFQFLQRGRGSRNACRN